MANPTDEQLRARGLSRDAYNKRNALWHALLAQKSAEERAAINAHPGGLEGLLLAGQVEMALAKQEDMPAEETPREDLECPPFVMLSEGGQSPDKLKPENERVMREYRERLARRPKFREIMLRGSTENWTLRFWFTCKVEYSAEVAARRAECHGIVRDIMCNIISESPATIEGIEIQIWKVLKSDDCAAYEILNGDTGNGDVVYLEWP